MVRNNVNCDQCKNYIGNNEFTWFSDIEKDLDFCSENCYLIWKEQFQTPQEWLDRNYFSKEIIFNTGLEFSQPGELIIADYPNLEKIQNIKKNEIKNITKVTISNCLQLKLLDITNFTDNQKLDIINCPNLKGLDCSNNQLSSLDVNECQNLRFLDCHCNKLTSLKFANLEQLDCSSNLLVSLSLCPKLTFLKISDNNISEQDLSVFSKLQLIDLETLYIGNSYYRKIKSGNYNTFTGSLESLKDLTKLKSLDISNTDVEGDLRYLPEETYCSSEARPESKVKTIEEALKNSESFTFNEGKYTRKKEVYIFEEHNFKDYLRRNATRVWFSKDVTNARYQNRAGTYDLHGYLNRYTVEVKDVLIDPGIKIDAMISQSRQRDNMSYMNTMLASSIANMATGVAELAGAKTTTWFTPTFNTPSPSASTIQLLNMANTYHENIYFTVAGSKWVAGQVPVNGIEQVAVNICEWSNQVWEEKFAISEAAQTIISELISNLSQQLVITPTPNDYEETIARKERELLGKKREFERLEKEIAILEEEIRKLKLEQQPSQVGHAPLPSSPQPQIPQNVFYQQLDKETGEEMYEALWDYEGEEKDKLSFKCGDALKILEKTNEDWWKGEKNGKIGIVPSNYLRKIDERRFREQLQSQIQVPPK